MKKILSKNFPMALEIFLVQFLLLLNVFMGYFTVHTIKEYSLYEKLLGTFTFENVSLGFFGGVTSYLVIRLIEQVKNKQ